MYATGTASSLSDFLNSLATFAASAGWTVDHNATISAGDYWLAVHKNACYLDYYMPPPVSGANTLIQLFGATGYNGSSAPGAQAGTSPNPTLLSPAPAGPFTAYHFFSTAAGGVNYLHALLEVSSGVFLHLHGGTLNAVGGASPVTYCAGTDWSSLSGGTSSSDGGPAGANNWTPFAAEQGPSTWRALQVLATVDSVSRWFCGAAGNASPARLIGAVKPGSRAVHAFAREPNTFNQLVPYIPLSIYLERLVGNIYSYVGDVYDVRWLNMQNNAPKDEITIGADTWKIYPVIAKLPFASATAGTNNYAFAFRKNA
jgi:hypothetical protein